MNHYNKHTHTLKFSLPGIIFLFLSTMLSGVIANEIKEDLTQISFEDLVNLEVSSVSKYSQKLSETAAAIYVITNEEIRRKGSTSIADSLRGVPGLEVARINNHNWAITSRGFNSDFANKLLVLIDGRSVYTPINSGVHWDTQDTLMEDIDRIEVIRGPGATLWGANAVNGVINVTTKEAKDTLGYISSIGTGTSDQIFGSLRYGGKITDDLYYRFFVKYHDIDRSKLSSGADANDQWDNRRSGFRLDWYPEAEKSFTLLGDLYNNKAEQLFNTSLATAVPGVFANGQLFGDTKLTGGHILGKYKSVLSNDSDIEIQAYYDRFHRRQLTVNMVVDTFDISLQHRFKLTDNHQIIWGAGYRAISDDLENTEFFTMTPDSQTVHIYNSFIQDEIKLMDDKLKLIFGTKIEINNYTNTEIQPNARLVYMPNDKNTLWGAVSRAVRTPSRSEFDLTLRSTLAPTAPLPQVLQGNDNYISEDLLAFEFGYRIQPNDRLNFDFAAYYNNYDNLRSFELTVSPPFAIFNVDNNFDGNAFGIELSSGFQVSDWWLLRTNYSYIELDLSNEGSIDTNTETLIEGSSPTHQIYLQSLMSLPLDIELDIGLRFVDDLNSQGISDYVGLDIHTSWRPTDNLELSIVGQSLLDSQHKEFSPNIVNIQITELESSVYGKITWKF